MAQNSYSSGSGARSAAKGFSTPAKFETKKTCEFSATDSNSFRLQVVYINDLPYVGLSKFWFEESAKKWIPTKKNFFMPATMWSSFAAAVSSITCYLKSAAATSSSTSMC